jgi:hypothetical protein
MESPESCSSLTETCPDVACSLCSEQLVESVAMIGASEPVHQSIKHRLFHDACSHCDAIQRDSQVTLCDVCRHLRIHHLLFCWRDWSQDLSDHFHQILMVYFEPFSLNSIQCDFCQFVVSIGENPLFKQEDVPVDDTWRLDFDTEHKHWSCNPAETCDYVTLSTMPVGDGKLVIEPYIDWQWLKKWLDLPHADSKSTSLELQVLSRQDLQDVRAIDVNSLCVVHLPPECDYLALSYVWGRDSGDVFRCEKSNVKMLAQDRSLENIELPHTVSDAILTCQKLDHRFIWVDRLCIVQDDEDIDVQLNQMAAIYHWAALTLVAVAGDDATHGLPGVSYPRNSKQSTLKFTETVQVSGPIPGLGACLLESIWRERAWTYQEYVASTKLLLFSDHGLYLQGVSRERKYSISEGPQYDYDDGGTEEPGLEMVSKFTEKTATYPNDRLRAVSGIMTAVFGHYTSFGIPWADFDVGMCWSPSGSLRPQPPMPPGTFPSWSWLSYNGPVRFPLAKQELVGVSCWGAPTIKQAKNRQSHAWTSKPAPAQTYDLPLAASRKDWLKLTAALAWSHGCIDESAPPCLLANYSHEEYSQRLEELWPDNLAVHWLSLLQQCEKANIFNDTEVRTLSAPDRLVVYTQKANFSLDFTVTTKQSWVSEHDTISYIIRTRDGKVAGSISLDDPTREFYEETLDAEFIALSVLPEYQEYKQWDIFDISTFYGCPCAHEMTHSTELDHIAECPYKDREDPPHGWPTIQLFWGDATRHEFSHERVSHAFHISTQCYSDKDGNSLLNCWKPPAMIVMMIVPSRRHRGPGKVYERLGVGRIYLKRWVEASRVFETIVLE